MRVPMLVFMFMLVVGDGHDAAMLDRARDVFKLDRRVVDAELLA